MGTVKQTIEILLIAVKGIKSLYGYIKKKLHIKKIKEINETNIDSPSDDIDSLLRD